MGKGGACRQGSSGRKGSEVKNRKGKKQMGEGKGSWIGVWEGYEVGLE